MNANESKAACGGGFASICGSSVIHVDVNSARPLIFAIEFPSFPYGNLAAIRQEQSSG